MATPVLADESVWTRRDLHQVVTQRAADLVNIKLAKTGGLHEALALARVAGECGVGVLVGCVSEVHVGIAAAGGPTMPQDLDAWLGLTASPVAGASPTRGSRSRCPRSRARALAA